MTEYLNVYNRETRSYKLVPETYVVGVTEPHLWARKVEQAVGKTESAIRQTVAIVTHLEGRVAAWVQKPLRTVEEEVRKAEVVKAERQAVLDAKRAARQAVLDAKAARKADMMARRFAEVAILANRVHHGQGVEVVHDVTHMAKYRWFRGDYTVDGAYQKRFFELCGPRLLELGLAYTNQHGMHLGYR